MRSRSRLNADERRGIRANSSAFLRLRLRVNPTTGYCSHGFLRRDLDPRFPIHSIRFEGEGDTARAIDNCAKAVRSDSGSDIFGRATLRSETGDKKPDVGQGGAELGKLVSMRGADDRADIA